MPVPWLPPNKDRRAPTGSLEVKGMTTGLDGAGVLPHLWGVLPHNLSPTIVTTETP